MTVMIYYDEVLVDVDMIRYYYKTKTVGERLVTRR